MKRPAVFFDRDNTLIVSDGFLGDPEGVVLVDGAPDAVAKARQYGFRAISFSNQSGVARGFFDEAAVQAVNQRMTELLQQANPAAIIEHHEYCPYHPEAQIEQYRQDSFLRKPKPGMILAAAEKLALDLSRSWVVGDAPRDIEAGKAAGCRTVLVKDPRLPPSPAAEQAGEVAPDFTVTSVREAVEVIARQSLYRPPASSIPAPSAKEEVMTHPASEAAATQAPPPAAPSAPANPPPPPPASTVAAEAPSTARLEKLLDQILTELRRRDEPPVDFSVSKLLAGIVQVLALAVLFLAYLRREDPNTTLMVALFLQTLTIALLIMGRQR